MSKKEIHRVSGTSFYACVHTPNKTAGKFTIDLSVDKKNAKILSDLGLKPARVEDGSPKTHIEGESVFRFKRNTTLPSGEPLNPPKVYGEDGRITTDLVGNGSKVQIAFTLYSGKLKTGATYVSNNLLGVKIDELVPFEHEPLFEGITAEEEKKDDTFNSIEADGII